MKPFVFICAGEDSGDILGEFVVRAVREYGFEAFGVGGHRMEQAGLHTIEHFENFPVSGFLDVLQKLSFFRQFICKAAQQLANPDCCAFFAIDYPGLNLKLVKLAKKYGKPVYYLAPPQIFAWKKNRAKFLKNTYTCAFFPFESKAYAEQGIFVNLVAHPFFETSKNVRSEISTRETIYFLPGSRERVLFRNLPLYIEAANHLSSFGNPVFVASRKTMYNHLKEKLPSNISVELMPENLEERAIFLSKAKLVIGNPGTALLEASLRGVPIIALIRPDFLTFALGKIFLKIRILSLPNLLLKKNVFPEIVAFPFQKSSSLLSELHRSVKLLFEESSSIKLALEKLPKTLEGNRSIQELVFEFLLKFVKR